MGFVSHAPMIANWFPRRRGLALGILSAGVTMSAIIAPGVQYLISSIGWKGAFLVLAGVSAFIMAPLAAIFQRHRPEDKGLMKDGGDEEISSNPDGHSDNLVIDQHWASVEWTPVYALKTVRFWWLSLTSIFLGFYCYILLAHQVAFLTDAGYSRAFAAGIVAIFCILGTVSSFCSFVSDYIGREVTFTLSSVCTLIGLVVMMSIKNTHYLGMPYIYALFFGFGYGLCIALIAVISADLFQGRHYGTINGICLSFFVFGGAAGPWLAGYVFDVTGSYDRLFPLMYFSIFASTAFIWLASPRKVRTVPGKVNTTKTVR
jgi:MFS family permease